MFYQVKSFLTCSKNEKPIIFEYLHLDISKYNQKICNLRSKIKSLKIELSNIDKSLSLMSLQLRNVSLTNYELNNEKDLILQVSQKC